MEATKLAFGLRDRYITDPALMAVDPQSLLEPAALDALAKKIRLDTAIPRGKGKGPGRHDLDGDLRRQRSGRVLYT